jgi:hypothetical protein
LGLETDDPDWGFFIFFPQCLQRTTGIVS